MNGYDRLLLRWFAGCFTTKAFHRKLNDIAWIVFTGRTLSDDMRDLWDQPEIQDYWRNHMSHAWVANGVNGGRIELGHVIRQGAIDQLVRTIPRAVIVHVDDNRHFIFYKIAE
jgi:hypothetical protein